MNIFFESWNFIKKCIRVWRVTRKPTTEEFKIISKASLLGILLIGLIGFIISLALNFFKF